VRVHHLSQQAKTLVVYGKLWQLLAASRWHTQRLCVLAQQIGFFHHDIG
jgi:hypothetical protein